MVQIKPTVNSREYVTLIVKLYVEIQKLHNERDKATTNTSTIQAFVINTFLMIRESER